jgi:prepilin-type N-terminal cleavage/methylation domain-containing protein
MLKAAKNIRQQGFTIIELLIVIAIIGILALLVITNFQGAQAKARDALRKSDVNSMYKKLEEFYGDFGYYPAQIPSQAIMPGLDPASAIDVDGLTIVLTTPVVGALTAPTYTDATEFRYTPGNCTNVTPTTLTAPPTTTPANVCAKYQIGSYTEKPAAGSFVKTSAN